MPVDEGNAVRATEQLLPWEKKMANTGVRFHYSSGVPAQLLLPDAVSH